MKRNEQPSRPVTTQQQGDGLVSGISGWWKDRRGQRQDPQNAAKNPLPLDDDKNGDDHDGEDDGGFASGWFPDAFTRNPSPLELAEMQASMLTVAGGEQEVVDVLAPPDHWDSKDNPDPLDAKIVELKASIDKEYNDAVEFFKASLGDSLKKLKSVKSVRRIESLSLWQSYVAKRRQLETRAIAEGKDEAYAKAYEQTWMFHGTSPDVISKVCAQGFNRSFCGKNAVVYGKGVYVRSAKPKLLWHFLLRICFFLFGSICTILSHTCAL